MIKPVSITSVIEMLHITLSPSVYHVTNMQPGIGTFYMLAKETDALVIDMDFSKDFPEGFLARHRADALAQNKHLVLVDGLYNPAVIPEDLSPVIYRCHVDYFG